MKTHIFTLEISGLGDTEAEAKTDAIEQIQSGLYANANELSQWLSLKSVEEVDQE